ncbi:MAG: rhodanese-like domain-containing protein [Campylobacterota bacterium]|nr:rhodanese-like domain-containing protein [Campylobacterota bacterium]
MKFKYFIFLFISTLMQANEVEIVKGLPFVEVEVEGKVIKIERNQVKDNYLTNTFALTSRPSPPFFIEPFSVSKGIETYGELEVLDFISKKKGLFIDARLSNWYKRSAIPSAVNIPFKYFLDESDKQDKVFKDLGGVQDANSEWNFKNAKTILLYCNGAWCGQSPTAMNALIENGYPEEKMKYYRGGMQSWQLLGLTTIVPKEKK